MWVLGEKTIALSPWAFILKITTIDLEHYEGVSWICNQWVDDLLNCLDWMVDFSFKAKLSLFYLNGVSVFLLVI